MLFGLPEVSLEFKLVNMRMCRIRLEIDVVVVVFFGDW